MKAIWSDGWDSSSSDEEKQVANICFMAIESKNKIQSMDDELNDVFESLYDEFKKLDSKYNILKRYCACLLVKKMLEKKACFEIDDSEKVNQLENENKSLKEKVDKLIITLTKFMQGSKCVFLTKEV